MQEKKIELFILSLKEYLAMIIQVFLLAMAVVCGEPVTAIVLILAALPFLKDFFVYRRQIAKLTKELESKSAD